MHKTDMNHRTHSNWDDTFQIDEKVYRGSGDTASETFLVDFTVGRNLVFRLDTDDRAHVTSSPHLIRPTGGIIGGAEFDPSSFVWTINVPMAEVRGVGGRGFPCLGCAVACGCVSALEKFGNITKSGLDLRPKWM